MLSCFVSSSAESIPIVLVQESEFTTWVTQQDERVQNWTLSTAFVAKAGSTLLISTPQGRLEKVIVGISSTDSLSVLGQLAITLPKGSYEIATSLSELDQYHAYLAWGLASYQFTLYKKLPPLETKLAISSQYANLSYLEAVLRATYLVRDLINTPAEDMAPEDLDTTARAFAEEWGAKVVSIIGDDLLAADYPCIHAVGRASQRPPYLIDMRWGEETNPKVTLVGKGVCFDSGGLDLKNPANMATMKKDMAGAAHVLGLAYIIMSLRLPIHLRVLIPAAENLVSGDSYHPGDVLPTRKGVTVEITNTDAEGRLLLSDALCEAATEHPDLLIDFATPTGAARVALGTDIAALFTRHDSLAAELMNCGKEENDVLWRLPIYLPYKKLLDSKIADISNSSSTPYGGAITAAVFLNEFVPDNIVWAHFDIMAWNSSNKPTAPEGGEAAALRAVARYLYKRFNPELR